MQLINFCQNVLQLWMQRMLSDIKAFRTNQNTIKVCIDGSKLDGRVGAGFYTEYPNNSPKQAFFHLRILSTMFQTEVLTISEVAKNLLLEIMHNQSIVVLVDCQAAIKSLIKCSTAL